MGDEFIAEAVTMDFNPEQSSYQDLRAIVAERTSPILIWTGAGLSAAAKLPSWSELRQILLKEARKKADGYLPEVRNKHLRNLESIADEEDYWIAFERIKKDLGETSWNIAVKAALTPAADAEIPPEYATLWKIPELRGIMNLNLDGLATRAFHSVNGGARLLEYGGPQAAHLANLPTSNIPFVINLHGNVYDSSTWVLTNEEIKRLSGNSVYRNFVRTCLASWVNLFMGMSVDDFAVGSHLAYLADRQLQSSRKFWLTHRRDQETDDWAEAAGIQVIKYEAPNGSHAPVRTFLDGLLNFVPTENRDYPPIAPNLTGHGVPIPSPAELVGRPAEELRQILNAHASRLLSRPGDEGLQAYEQFIQDYAEQIHWAWFLDIAPGRNQLLGHHLDEKKAAGAFGTVYRATGPSGEHEAVKVLHSNIRDDREKLQAFRRGVKSMRILQEQQVSGMVAYKEACEIPAFVSMEWIDGPNLTEAKEAQYIEDWTTVLRVGVELSRIIKDAHSLTQQVLHRDLRPPNIMLEGRYDAGDDWRVVVLDFDLSWHQGGGDQSVLHSASGYLAPEQTTHIRGTTTRSGAVDSFGLGMTLFYLCSGKDPYPGQHTGERWRTDVQQATSAITGTDWRSLPKRYTRCVLGATADHQLARTSVPAIHDELSRLRAAHLDPDRVSDTELIAEEIAARSEAMCNYEWDVDTSSARYAPPTGVVYQLQGDESKARILLDIRFTSRGQHDRSNLTKYLNAKGPGVVSVLKKGKWHVTDEQHGQGQLKVSAWIDADQARQGLDRFTESVDASGALLRF